MISYRKCAAALLTLFLGAMFVSTIAAGQAPPEMKAKLAVETKKLAVLAADPTIVEAVKEHNAAHPTAEATAMTNEKWRSLSVLDPFVRATAKVRCLSI